MDIKEFLSKYFEEITYCKQDGGYQIAFPFKLYNDDHISSVFIAQDSTGLFTVNDNGNTFNYLENMGVNIENYAQKFKKLCKMYHLTVENGVITSVLGEYETNQTFIQFTNFLIGISHVATLKYFD